MFQGNLDKRVIAVQIDSSDTASRDIALPCKCTYNVLWADLLVFAKRNSEPDHAWLSTCIFKGTRFCLWRTGRGLTTLCRTVFAGIKMHLQKCCCNLDAGDLRIVLSLKQLLNHWQILLKVSCSHHCTDFVKEHLHLHLCNIIQ